MRLRSCRIAFVCLPLLLVAHNATRGDDPNPRISQVPERLNFGPIRVGAIVEMAANIIINEPELDNGLSAKITPPAYLQVKSLQVREQNYNGTRRLIQVGLALDTTKPGDIDGVVRVEYGTRQFEIPVEGRILPSNPKLTKVLVISPGFGDASSDSSYYQPWFDLIKEAGLDVSYVDPSREGLPNYGEGLGSRETPDWLKAYDVVLLAGGGSIYINNSDISTLQNYVRGGGRLVVNASSFMSGSVIKANPIIEPFGLALRDTETNGSATPRRPWFLDNQNEIIINGPFTSGVGKVAFTRVSPVEITDHHNAELLIRDPQYPSQGFAAIARDKGEVIVLGPSLLFGWIDEGQDAGADNARFLQNLLKKPREE